MVQRAKVKLNIGRTITIHGAITGTDREGDRKPCSRSIQGQIQQKRMTPTSAGSSSPSTLFHSACLQGNAICELICQFLLQLAKVRKQ